MSYVKNILVAIDQVGNALAGGNPDNTISGRTGYFAEHGQNYSLWFWILMESIIDTTFFPFDGPGHCAQAYELEKDEEFYLTRKIALVVFAIIAVISCMVLIVPFYLFHLIRWVIRKIKKK
jgi:hypothetical protein